VVKSSHNKPYDSKAEAWVTRGIVSSALLAGSRCNQNTYLVYTDVVKFHKWIRRVTGLGDASTNFVQPASDCKSSWLRWDINKGIPSNAFKAGIGSDGVDLYIIRATYGNATIPGKFWARGRAFILHEGKKFEVEIFEILKGQCFEWKTFDSEVPSNTLVGGKLENGDKLYVGRISYDEATTPGTIPHQNQLVVMIDAKRVNFTEYYVLSSATCGYHTYI